MSAILVGLLCFGIACFAGKYANDILHVVTWDHSVLIPWLVAFCCCGIGLLAAHGSFALTLIGGLLVSVSVGTLATGADR